MPSEHVRKHRFYLISSVSRLGCVVCVCVRFLARVFHYTPLWLCCRSTLAQCVAVCALCWYVDVARALLYPACTVYLCGMHKTVAPWLSTAQRDETVCICVSGCVCVSIRTILQAALSPSPCALPCAMHSIEAIEATALHNKIHFIR